VTPARIRLDHPALAERTGKGVRVAVIDSGIASGHPHVGIVDEGIAIRPVGTDMDFRDRIGHGTAVAAAIREKAPDAELVAVRVFAESLTTSTQILARAIEWAAMREVALINLSLGTVNPLWREMLVEAVDAALSRGALIVAARARDGEPSLPGSLPGVVAVDVDWECDRHELELVDVDGVPVLRASAYPRPVPGVPPARNLSGISFAVANVTGFLARTAEGMGRPLSIREIVAELWARARLG
jgi:subtilisin family serine protease